MIHFLAGFISGRNKKGADTLPPFCVHSALTCTPVASVTAYVRSVCVCTESYFRYLPSVRRAYVRIYNPRSRHTVSSLERCATMGAKERFVQIFVRRERGVLVY